MYYRISSIAGWGSFKVPDGEKKDENNQYYKIIRFVVSTFPIEFQLIEQTGINDPKPSMWKFEPEGSRGDKDEVKFFKIMDVVFNIIE